MILIDTSVWIDFFKEKNNPYVRTLEILIEQREDICLCGVILAEILQGIEDEKEFLKTESLLNNLIYLPMSRDTFFLAAKIYRRLRSRGVTIRKSIDCMIAAVAIENKIFLLHNDEDFNLIVDYFKLQIVEVSDR
ncbi:MAG: PIN domain nuclease [Candidatus Omnitrophica bacterium]|nr:PIN domain nuclease [Candidatus Omnitrophota bacterium]